MNKKTVLFITVLKDGKQLQEFFPERFMTIGESRESDIMAKLTGFPVGKMYRLLEKTKDGYRLLLPFSVADATLSIDAQEHSIKGLASLGLLEKRGDLYIFPLPWMKECVLQLKELSLVFGYTEIIIPEKPKFVLDKSFKKPLIAKEDYRFSGIFIVSVIVHAALFLFLLTIEIQKPEGVEAIKKVAPRFAKLILKAPKPKPKPSAPSITTAGELGEAGKPGDKKKKKKKVKKEKRKKGDQGTNKKIKPKETRKSVRARMRKSGLAGIISSRKRVSSVFKTEVFTKADKMIKTMDVRKSRGKDRAGEIVSQIDVDKADKVVDASELAVGSRTGKDTEQLLRERGGSSFLGSGTGGGGTGGLGRGGGKGRTVTKISRRQRNEAEVYKIIMRNIGALKYLYNRALRKDMTLKGAVTVKFVITPEGSISKIELIGTTLKSKPLVDKMIKRIYKWKFPVLKDVDDFVITYTFDFSPVG